MIAWLRGTILEKASDSVVVDVGGVGYRLFVTGATLGRLPPEGAGVELRVHMVMRDDAIQLYGFLDEEERQAFLSLLGVAGIGPRLARTILTGIGPQHLAEAVVTGKSEKLELIPGVGRRTAQRIVVELKGKVEGFRTGGPSALASEFPQPELEGLWRDVLSALGNLGYRPSEAKRAATEARQGLKDAPTVESWVREALKLLAPSP